MGSTPPDPMVFRSDDVASTVGDPMVYRSDGSEQAYGAPPQEYGYQPGYQGGYEPPAQQYGGYQGGGKGKGKGGKGKSGKGKGKGGKKGGKGSGYGDGYGSGYGDGYGSGYAQGYGQDDLSGEEEAFLEQMQQMNVSASKPASTEPLPEYETYLDTNTGHQRLKGGALEIREPTEEEKEKARLEELEEDC